LHVSGWEDLPLAEELKARLSMPVYVVNDGTAGAIGEWLTGAGEGLRNLAYLTVSTGVGGGLILNGSPFEGAAGLAAEFGHLRVPGSDEPCTCGRLGCLEAVAAGPAIARAAARSRSQGTLTSLPADANGADLAEHAGLGDTLSIDVLRSAGRAVGLIATEICTAFDPEAIVIGGGVSEAGEPFWSAIAETFSPPFPDERNVSVVPAIHRRDAPLRGAAALARANTRKEYRWTAN
jgi:glucokinase